MDRTGAAVRSSTRADILTHVTSTVVRRLLLAATPLGIAVAAVLLTAGPASADTPEGWPEEESIDMLQMLLFGRARVKLPWLPIRKTSSLNWYPIRAAPE